MVFIVAALLVCAGSAWGVDSQKVIVPVSGTFQDANLGGWISYNGNIALQWTPATESGQTVWNLVATLTAEAWSYANLAGYTLYGICDDRCTVSAGETIEIHGPVLAIGKVGRQQPTETQVTMALELQDAAQPPVMASLAFAER
jgi:hypothetical protein